MRTSLYSLAATLAFLAGGSSLASAHSGYEARDKLSALGYHDIRTERISTPPYSFTGCKHGTRYHIHVDYYGELTDVDEVGRCGGYERDQSRYEEPRRYRRYNNYNRYNRYGGNRRHFYDAY